MNPVHSRSLAGLVALVALVLSLPASAAGAPVPLAQVGAEGSAAGQLSDPQGVAIDAAGNLYVADRGNMRISKFAANGTFIHAFGWGVDDGAAEFQVCTTTSTCQAGIFGSGAGQFKGARGLAIDGAGNLYAVDGTNNRINVFSTAGPTFTHAFGWGVDDGTAEFQVCTTLSGCDPGPGGGGGNGRLNQPFGAAIDGAGKLYVADAANNRISVFNTGAVPSFSHGFGWDAAFPIDAPGSFEVCPTDGNCQIGPTNGGAGGFHRPEGVTLDGAGNLYVADELNQRIDVFATAGPTFTRAFGWDVADDVPAAFEVCPTQGACQQGDQGAGAGQLDDPYGVALDGAGGLYVADSSNNRISRFAVAGPTFTDAFGWGVGTGASMFQVCTSACQIGSTGGGAAGAMDFPIGIAADCRGAAWVADFSGRVQRFGEAGTASPDCTPPSTVPATTAGPTGQRAAALKKCKKKKTKAKRKKCRKKANQLPV